MSPFRYRDDESSSGSTIATALLGAVAGFAVGMYVAQRVGGFSGLTSRIRRRGAQGMGGSGDEAPQFDFAGEAYDEIEDESEEEMYAGDDSFDEMDEESDVPLLEERVLEAFNNVPILAERAIDIGTVGAGIIELAGWVESDDEAEHAITVARGVPEVETVVNRLMIEDEESQLDDNQRRRQAGDPALSDARWEGQQVGTGRRRQGTSAEADRHADPKPGLEERWLSESEALRNSADDIDAIAAERRGTRGTRGKSGKPPRADEAEPAG